MKERPIIFSAAMVRAILEDRKTQTRRVCKPAEHENLSIVVDCEDGKPGDRLWIRENWKVSSAHDDLSIAQLGRLNPLPSLEYLADPEKIFTGKTRPSIYMPRWASRITLEITGVRVERLQDISEVDAIREGIVCPPMYAGEPVFDCKLAYQVLWESINGKGSWDENPWVWVLEFKRVY